MIPATGYYLRLIVYRQAVLAPVLAYLCLVAIIYANPAGPPLSPGSITAVALMPLTAWLVRLTATCESAPFAEITLTVLGGPLRRQAARLAATLAVTVALGVVAVVWGSLANPEPYLTPTVVTLLGMHAAEACAGAGVGILLSPPLRVRVGTAVTVVTVVTLASLVVPWLPPLNPLLRAVYIRDWPGPGLLLAVIGQAWLVGLAGVLASVALIRNRAG
ncbi:MAG TPA: hypothetical protein VH641_03265 [Streptosporangiaceae bacterium]|jgi:hypothetical protein